MDLIERQQAIDALEQIFDRCEEIEAHLPEGDPDRTGYKMYPDYMTVWKYLHQLPSAQPDLDSAYTEGYTQEEAKYRKMWDEMQANIKEKAFGKRKGLVHTADIDAMPTIEERKTGKWVGIKEYCDHLNEEAEREGKGNRYLPSGMNIRVYCNQCWKPNDRRTTYCPNCSARMVQEGEDNG